MVFECPFPHPYLHPPPSTGTYLLVLHEMIGIVVLLHQIAQYWLVIWGCCIANGDFAILYESKTKCIIRSRKILFTCQFGVWEVTDKKQGKAASNLGKMPNLYGLKMKETAKILTPQNVWKEEISYKEENSHPWSIDDFDSLSRVVQYEIFFFKYSSLYFKVNRTTLNRN